MYHEYIDKVICSNLDNKHPPTCDLEFTPSFNAEGPALSTDDKKTISVAASSIFSNETGIDTNQDNNAGSQRLVTAFWGDQTTSSSNATAEGPEIRIPISFRHQSTILFTIKEQRSSNNGHSHHNTLDIQQQNSNDSTQSLSEGKKSFLSNFKSGRRNNDIIGQGLLYLKDTIDSESQQIEIPLMRGIQKGKHGFEDTVGDDEVLYGCSNKSSNFSSSSSIQTSSTKSSVKPLFAVPPATYLSNENLKKKDINNSDQSISFKKAIFDESSNLYHQQKSQAPQLLFDLLFIPGLTMHHPSGIRKDLALTLEDSLDPFTAEIDDLAKLEVDLNETSSSNKQVSFSSSASNNNSMTSIFSTSKSFENLPEQHEELQRERVQAEMDRFKKSKSLTNKSKMISGGIKYIDDQHQKASIEEMKATDAAKKKSQSFAGVKNGPIMESGKKISYFL